jgi:hypothetical protein
MKNILKKLNYSLKKNNLYREAQEIKDLEEYAEPWHQDAVEEFGDEIIPESDEDALKDLEEKYTYNRYDTLKNINEYFKDDPYMHYSLDEAEIIQNILDRENFKSLEQSRNFVAGKGMFGIVLRGVYQGKPAVIKIETSATRPVVKEINNWVNILKLKNFMPPEYKKHIPEIYKLNSGKINSEELDVYYSVIIMEELFKLSDDLNDFLSNQGNLFVKSMKDKLSEPGLIHNLASLIFEKLNKINFLKFKLPSVNEISAKLIENIDNHYDMASGICKIMHEKNEKIDHYTISDFNQEIIYVLKTYFSKSIEFPTQHLFFDKLEKSTWGDFPETKSLLEFLVYIKNNANLSWRDLHTGNIMMDRDGNLKIIDVGLYEENMT